MERVLCFTLVVAVLMCFLSSSSAYDFYVGGKDGWVLSPSESYAHWAERMRFQVNDKLVFKYKKGEDSVLVVGKESFEKCNTTSPITRLDGGDSVFQFDRSGPFYFISGEPGNCEKGQKLPVVVMAVRKKKPSPAPSPSPHVPSDGPVSSPAPSPAPPSSNSSSSSSSAAPSDGLRIPRVHLGVGVGLVLGFVFLN